MQASAQKYTTNSNIAQQPRRKLLPNTIVESAIDLNPEISDLTSDANRLYNRNLKLISDKINHLKSKEGFDTVDRDTANLKRVYESLYRKTMNNVCLMNSVTTK